MTVTRYKKEYEAVRKMFWDGKDEYGNQYFLDRAGIKYALGRALKDYTSRTDKKEAGEGILSVKNMTAVLSEFIDCFEKYFTEAPKASSTEYDLWHHNMCQLFMSCITTASLRNTVTYGKAQKIVNMTMKNVFCLQGAETKDRSGYFEFCHMALDSIVLDWFCTYVAQRWFNKQENRKRTEKILISRERSLLPKWSGMEFMPDSMQISFADYERNVQTRCFNGHYHYYFFVMMIRTYFQGEKHPYGGLTPFKAEFYIWQETQMEAAAEALYGLDIERDQIIEQAKNRWEHEWAEQNMEEKISNVQFKWCKKMFKGLSVQEKVAFLSGRVAQLCKYVNVSETAD